MSVLWVRGPPDTNDYSLHCSHYSLSELQFKSKLIYKKVKTLMFNTSEATKTMLISGSQINL